MDTRDYKLETAERVGWIREVLAESGAKGIIFANGGGKDSTLVGILCRMATENVLGIIMPCDSRRNYGEDRDHALLFAERFNIKTETVDLGGIKTELLRGMEHITAISAAAGSNINPRLRMTVLYALGQTNGMLVAGTSNRSELYMGYFTKWGDGASDFNPIADLSVREVYGFLEYLNAPAEIIAKAPSAGLYDGQTDEQEMGVTYRAIEEFMNAGTGTPEDIARIKAAHAGTEHKRALTRTYRPARP